MPPLIDRRDGVPNEPNASGASSRGVVVGVLSPDLQHSQSAAPPVLECTECSGSAWTVWNVNEKRALIMQ
jgi:hypothetical protein